MAKERLLLVDDEENLRSMLEAALRHDGFEVHPAATGREALDRVAATCEPDLIVLDVMLPDLDGFEVCKRLRTEGMRTPVLFLTARDGTDDKVRGLTLGGDDYLVKPFSLEELVARINAVLRRAGLAQSEAVMSLRRPRDGRRRAPGAARRQRRVALADRVQAAALPPHQPGPVVSKAQILDHVWQYDFGGDGGVVETYIGYLRRKLDNADPRLIHTIRGVGYTLARPAA